MKTARVVVSVLFVSAALSACWAFWLEPASLRVARSTIALTDWPKSCDGMHIAVLSDLHVGSPFNGIENLQKIVEQTQLQKPDLILLPGDFVIQGVLGGDFVTPEIAAEVLAQLHAPLGVYAVLGNHDWWLDGPRVQRALEQNGIAVLEDRSRHIGDGPCQLYLAGISDYWEGAHDIDAALSAVPDDGALLVFTHNPDVFPDIPSRATLTIAGHTHGGQVYIPGVGRPVVPSKYGDRYAIGHIKEGPRNLFVSSGVGTSILPVRFLVPPEITIITVVGESAQEDPKG